MSLTFNFDVNPYTSGTQTLGSSSSKWLLNGYLPEIILVQISATNETSYTAYNSSITENHVVINDHMQIAEDVSYTTSSGNILVTCPSGIPAMTLLLGVRA